MAAALSIKSRQQRPPPPKQSIALQVYNMFLVIFTATITWMFSRYVNMATWNSFISSGGISPRGEKSKSTTLHETAGRVKHVPTVELPKGHIDYSDYTGPSRVFTKFDHPFPCFKGEPQLMLETPAHEGILFQRPMKTGSTTLTGIVLRLVHNRGKQMGFEKCKHRCMHGLGVSYDFGHRDKTKSFLFSIIRDPQARALSQIFHFEVSTALREPTDEFLQNQLLVPAIHVNFLHDLKVRNYTDTSTLFLLRNKLARKLGYKSAQEQLQVQNQTSPNELRHAERLWKQWRLFGHKFNVQTVIGHILEDYNFIAVTERMDESLVVLQMLLNLTTKEIVYTKARTGGSFSNGYATRPCIYILPSFTSPGMKRFFASEEWQLQIAADVELYKAVHKSLDRTIEALGRQEFEEKLVTFQAALKLASTHCAGRVRTMCSSGGEVIRPVNTTCYFWGEGCDHDCIDELDL
jgi:hypothetical protein